MSRSVQQGATDGVGRERPVAAHAAPVSPSDNSGSAPRRTDTRSFALRLRCCHNDSMSVQITIRGVPERVKDELASRAALQGKSMEEFLRAELERIASRPTIENWLEQVRKRKRASQLRISARQILDHREADRR